MNRMLKNIKRGSVLLLALFLVVIGYFSYAVYFYGTKWFSSPNNPRLKAEENNIIMGTVFDRNGEKMAWSTAVGQRTYSENAAVRLGSAHLLGDKEGLTTGGAENTFTRYLLGFDINTVERIIETFKNQERRGEDVTLTVDAALQAAGYNAFGGKAGAAVVLNYKTGEVLASISSPTFDPNTLTKDQAGSLAEGTLVNRATQGKYPPGSTFKLITATAMLEHPELVPNATYDCSGQTTINGQVIRCYNSERHGHLDLASAISKSCNGAFATWAQGLGMDVMMQTAEKYGFNDEFLFKDCTVYDSQFAAMQTPNDLAWAAVGQYKTLMSPMHACMIAASIANDGVMMEPRLLDHVTSTSGRTHAKGSERVYKTVTDAGTANQITEMMRLGVESGTARGAGIAGVKVCGKTGTAEVGEGITPHGWFVGFIDDASAPYAVAVVVDNGGTGNSAAAPIAKALLQKCLEVKP
nr:penicillin-binding transpeptidase domain-containing protein [Maliibacterium massiliense]